MILSIQFSPTGDQLYDQIQIHPAVSEDALEDHSEAAPILPPRRDISSELDTYLEPVVYSKQVPRCTVHFRIAIGEAHKFNPKTDTLFLCIGNTQQNMEVEK